MTSNTDDIYLAYEERIAGSRGEAARLRGTARTQGRDRAPPSISRRRRAVRSADRLGGDDRPLRSRRADHVHLAALCLDVRYSIHHRHLLTLGPDHSADRRRLRSLGGRHPDPQSAMLVAILNVKYNMPLPAAVFVALAVGPHGRRDQRLLHPLFPHSFADRHARRRLLPPGRRALGLEFRRRLRRVADSPLNTVVFGNKFLGIALLFWYALL